MPEITEKPAALNLLALILLIPAVVYLVRVEIGLAVALAVLGAAQVFAMIVKRPRVDFGVSAALLLWIALALIWTLVLALRGAGVTPFLLTAIFTAIPAVCAWWAVAAARKRRV